MMGRPSCAYRIGTCIQAARSLKLFAADCIGYGQAAHSRLPYRPFLLDYAAGKTSASATQRGRVIGMIVPAHMDHQRTPLDIGQLQPWRQNRVGGAAASIDIQGR